MSISEQVKQLVDTFIAEPRLKDKTEYMGEGLLLAASLADSSERVSQNLQRQFDQLVVEGDSSVEAAQARIDNEGNQFGTLKERLDSKDIKVDDLNNKVNAVDLKPYLDNRNNILHVAINDWLAEQNFTPIQSQSILYLPLNTTVRLTGLANIPENITLSIPESCTISNESPSGRFRLNGKSGLIGSGIIDFNFLNNNTAIECVVNSDAEIIGIEIKQSKSDVIHFLEGSKGKVSQTHIHSIDDEDNVDQIGIRVLTNEPVFIHDNDLHDIKGNAIYLDGQALSDKVMNLDIQHNRIYDISNNWGTGQYGNGIHGWVAHNLMIKHNTVIRCSFSCIRLAACEDSEVSSNNLENPISVDDGSGVFIEFTTINIIVNNNILTNANIMMRNQEESNAKDTTCIGNILNGGWISTEADTVVENNIVEIGEHDHKIGILLGWGKTCFNLAVANNIIKDSKPEPTLITGIAVLYQWNAGTDGRWYNVKIADNVVRGARASISGHKDGDPINPSGMIEPVPDFVEMLSNNDGHNIDQYYGYSRSGQTQVEVVVGILPKFGENQYFFTTSADRRMLKVTVEGSRWNEGTYYQREYVASTFQSGNAVQRKNAFGTTGNEALLVYEDADNYYFIMRLSGYWNVSIKSEFIGAYSTTLGGGHEKFIVNGLAYYGLNLSQLTNVTSAFPVTEVV